MDNVQGDQTGSILDRVLSQKQTQEIEHFNPVEVVTTLLKSLPTREEDILRRRHALNGEDAQTLEMIGTHYKVTRERVRQIATGAIGKLRKLHGVHELLQPVADAITTVLDQHGGVMREEMFLQHLLGVNDSHAGYRACTLFLMEFLLADRCKRFPENPGYWPAWQSVTAPVHLVADTIDEAIRILEARKAPVKLHDLLHEISLTPFAQEHRFQLTDDAIAAYVDVSTALARNPYDEYGLVAWGSIIPKRMNDKIHLVLQKAKKPQHFNDITRLINEAKFDHRTAYAPTVHNELILNKDYVLIGRGIYALREWGFQPGVVADILVNVLQKAGRPMRRDALVQEVLKQRVVKRNTIHLALTNRSKFTKLPTGEYTLANVPSA